MNWLSSSCIAVIKCSSLNASLVDLGSTLETKVVWLQKFVIVLLVHTPLLICPMMFSTERSLGILHSLGSSHYCRFSIGCFAESTDCFFGQFSRFFKKIFCSSSSALNFIGPWSTLLLSSKTVCTDSSTVMSLLL